MRTVSQVARLVGITVRTLHHYDEIGLLRPSTRTVAGYRLYDRGDLERLQEVLFWRQLGYGLEEIRAVLDDPAHDRLTSLRHQLEELRERADDLTRTIAAVESALKAEQGGSPMSDKEMFADLFDGFDPSEYEAEVEERWGDSDAYRESKRRTSAYGREQWEQIKAESDRIEGDFVALLDAGVAPTSPDAVAVAEAHRQHLGRWFYECSPEFHRNLGEMYVEDPRFTEHYDRRRPGLALYVRDAIVANAAS